MDAPERAILEEGSDKCVGDEVAMATEGCPSAAAALDAALAVPPSSVAVSAPVASASANCPDAAASHCADDPDPEQEFADALALLSESDEEAKPCPESPTGSVDSAAGLVVDSAAVSRGWGVFDGPLTAAYSRDQELMEVLATPALAHHSQTSNPDGMFSFTDIVSAAPELSLLGIAPVTPPSPLGDNRHDTVAEGNKVLFDFRYLSIIR